MRFDKKDIETYLQGVRDAIDVGKYQIAPRPKNRALLTDYIISEKEELDIIRKLTPMDFSNAVPNDHKGREYETLYIFGKDIKLLERFGNQEKNISLYIKFNKIFDQYLFVISFHEQEYPLAYYFNKCSKNSPTSSGGEMNCTSEHICSRKSYDVKKERLFP